MAEQIVVAGLQPGEVLSPGTIVKVAFGIGKLAGDMKGSTVGFFVVEDEENFIVSQFWPMLTNTVDTRLTTIKKRDIDYVRAQTSMPPTLKKSTFRAEQERRDNYHKAQTPAPQYLYPARHKTYGAADDAFQTAMRNPVIHPGVGYIWDVRADMWVKTTYDDPSTSGDTGGC